jgi:hypothetical protein
MASWLIESNGSAIFLQRFLPGSSISIVKGQKDAARKTWSLNLETTR